MGDLKSMHNRAVWFDIPVAELERAAGFYAAVLAIKVSEECYEGTPFCVFEHGEGNGGCLVIDPEAVTGNGGILAYLNVDGRIRDAVAQVETKGGRVLQGVHPIGPHGSRALVLDSEGNRIALHSTVDT